MVQVIYIDILFCINLFINYFILLATSKILNISTKLYRLLLAATFGAFYSLVIFLPYFSNVLLFLSFLICSVVIILICFNFSSFKAFIKILVCFFIINLSFAGSLILLRRLFNIKAIIIKNGILYFDFSPITFIVSCIISYIIIRIAQMLNIKFRYKNNTIPIQVFFNGKHLNLSSKLDTGNNLVEPFSSLPVIIVKKQSLEKFLNCRELFSANLVKKLKVRMIPYKSVGKAGGILKGFKADYVCIFNEKTMNKRDAYIAICENNILPDEFDALLNPALLD